VGPVATSSENVVESVRSAERGLSFASEPATVVGIVDNVYVSQLSVVCL
jgi:hypothetical protein